MLEMCLCVCPPGLACILIVVQMALFYGVGCCRAPVPTDGDINVGLLCAADCRNHGSCAESSDSAIEAYDGDADRDEDRLLDQDEEIAVAWADLQESDVPADVHISEFLQADSCLVVQLSLGSSPPTTLSGSGTTAGSQLGSPTSLPEAFTAPSSGGEGSSGGSPSDGGSGGSAALPQLSTKCSLCHDTFTIPKVLNCLHTFCQPCLEKESGLPSDYAVSNILETAALEGASLGCTGCKGKESSAVARCFDCANFLCPNCVMAHQFMHCFEGHRVLTLGELQSARDGLRAPQDKPVACLRHRSEALRYFCRSCDTPVCKECALLDHPKAMHDLEPLSEAAPRHVEGLSHMVEDGTGQVARP
ncbi:hypothetical protein MRX96_055799 [Rhipicephalus microplus]